MDNFLNSLLTPELWFALLGAGGLLKLIEYIMKRIFEGEDIEAEREQTEKDNLRIDIQYLRNDVSALRMEVAELKDQLFSKDTEISLWQKRYWATSAGLDRVMIFLRYNASKETREGMDDILRSIDEVESDDFGE